MPIRPFPDPSNPASTAPPIEDIPNPISKAAKDATTKLAAKTEVSVAKQEQIMADTLSASGVIQESTEKEGRNAAIVINTANIAELEAQNKAIATAEAAGGIEFQTQLMGAFKDAGKELLERNEELKTVTDRDSTGVIDWFVKQFEIEDATRVAATAEDRRDDIGETIVGINTAQESIVRSLNTTKKTLNAASIEASANVLDEQTTIKAAKAQLEGLQLNSANLARSMTMSSQDVSAKIRLVELAHAETNQAAREKAFVQQEEAHAQRLIEWTANAKARSVALQRAEVELSFATDPKTIALRTADRDRKFANMQDTIAFEADFVSNVQKGQTALGLPIETAATIKLQGMNAKTVGERDRYLKLRQTGMREGDFGLSPADAFQTLATTGGNPDLPAVGMLIGLNQSYLTAKGREKIPKDQKVYNQEFDAHVKPKIADMRTEIKSGDMTNIFHAPPMTVLAERADVKASKLFKVALEAQGMKEFNDRRIYDLAAAAIATKDLTIEEAVLGIETLFNGATDQNNESKMFARAGITPQSTYKSRIIPSPFLSGPIGAPLRAAGALLTAGATLPGTVARTFIGVPEIPLTDNTNPTQIRQALIKVISANTPLTFFGAELKGASPFQPVLKGNGGEE